MTNNYYTVTLYGVHFFGDHDGCPDDWCNMHDEELVALFETKEMAEEYITGLALGRHLAIEKLNDGNCYKAIGLAPEVAAMSELQKEACGLDDGWEYDSYGWSIEEHTMYSKHYFDRNTEIDES